jgi:predicted GNAT family N-acyltransferase
VTVDIFGIGDAERMRVALAIRTRVFVDEQGVPSEDEIDEHDRTDPGAVHALVRSAEQTPALGAGRFYVLMPDTVQIGRMAVLSDARGSGAGRALLQALCTEAQRLGFRRAHLHAQMQARAFYLKSGFRDDGDTLWDAGILHQPMSLSFE